jgi:DNA-binding transcriptional ArsR family regulator
MLEPLFGSAARERVLLWLLSRPESYPREMAAGLEYSLGTVQGVLAGLEEGGVVVSFLRGKVRLYRLNPRYPFRRELEALLQRALEFYPAAERERLFTPRLRPRRPGKRVRYVEGSQA